MKNSTSEKVRMSDHNKLMRLVTSAVMISMAFVLSFVKFTGLPYSGSVTCFSMVPIVILGCMYGNVWGLGCGLIYGVLQAMQGAMLSKAFIGMGAGEIVAVCFLDYIAAFTVLGLGGMFIKKAVDENNTGKIITCGAIGAFVVSAMRYVIHIISGAVLYGSYAEWFFTEEFVNGFGNAILDNFSGAGLATVYSAVYNGLYMIPEIIITVAGTIILLSIKPIRQRITAARKL